MVNYIHYGLNATSQIQQRDTSLAVQATAPTTAVNGFAHDPANNRLYASDNGEEVIAYDYSLNKLWTYAIPEPEPYIESWGGDVIFPESNELTRLDGSDGSKKWTTNQVKEFSGVVFDGTYIWATVSGSYIFKLDPADGSRSNNWSASKPWYDITYNPDTGAFYLCGYDSSSSYISKVTDTSTWSPVWTKTFSTSSYGDFKHVRIDSSGNVYSSGDRVVKVDSSGTVLWEALTGSNGATHSAHPHPGGAVYTKSSDSNTIYKFSASDGSTLKTDATPGGSLFAVTAYPQYSHHSGVWSTTVTKSASATQYSASATMETSSGTAFAGASTTPTASTTTMPTVSGDKGLTASSTPYTASTSMQTPSGAKGVTAVGTDVAASSSLETPSVLTTVAPTADKYLRLSDLANTGLRDVALSDGSASSVTATKTVYVDSHTQDETGALYVTGGGSLTKYAYDGTVEWETAGANTNYTSPVVTDRGYVYYIERPSSADDRIVKADRGTGNVVWSILAANPDSAFHTLEVDAGNALYYHTDGNAVRSYAVSDGTEQWLSTNSHQEITVGPTGTVYAFQAGTSPNKLKAIDPNDGTETTPGLTASGTLYRLQADDAGDVYTIRDDGTSFYLEKYAPGGTQRWSHTMSGSSPGTFALNVDGGVTYGADVSGAYHHIRLDSSGSQDWDVTRSYNFALIHPPKYSANESAWMSTTEARVDPTKISASGTPATPTPNGSASSSSTPVTASTTMSASTATGSTSGGATAVASSATLATPDPNGQIAASSTKISATSAPNSAAATGVASPTANPYPSSATMRVAQRGNIAYPTATPVGATTSMQAPSSQSSATSSATVVDATTSETAVNSTGIKGATSTPVSATGGLVTPASNGITIGSATSVPATSTLQTARSAGANEAVATNVGASGSMRTPQIARLATSIDTQASASSTLSDPTTTVGMSASASKYGAVADLRVPLIALEAVVEKYGVQAGMNTAISFAPRRTALESDGPTIVFTGRGSSPSDGVDDKSTRNESDE